MSEIDLRIHTVPPAQRVWRLFPGTSYQFLDAFIDQKVGFLDFPALVLPEGRLSASSDLIARIALSQNAKATMQQHGIGATFNDDVKHFAGARHTKTRGRFRQALINFYEEAKEGDLVVVPESLVANRVWIGQTIRDNYCL